MKLKSIFFISTELVFCTARFTGSDIKLFVSMLNGHYSNRKDLNHQEKIGLTTKQNIINVNFWAIQLPAVQAEFVVYFEKYVDDVMYLQHVLALTEENNLIKIQQYNFTNPENFIPGTFQLSDLESLSSDNLTTRPECQSIVRRVDKTVFITEWPDCTRYSQSLARYSITITCRSCDFVSFHNNFYETPSKIPYELNIVERYPVPASVIPDSDSYLQLCAK